jgi:hypothetical protein
MVGLRWVRLASAGSDDNHEHAALDYPRTVAGQIVADADPVKRLEVQRRLDLEGRLAGERDRPLSCQAGPRDLRRSVRQDRWRRRGSQGVTGIALREVGVPAWALEQAGIPVSAAPADRPPRRRCRRASLTSRIVGALSSRPPTKSCTGFSLLSRRRGAAR